ncbi:putative zinc finger protein, partial [Plenodomus tracheiphilus IPT5]
YNDDECETCDREFGSTRAAIQHMNALDHWAQRYECDTCDREFFSQRSVDQHMDALDHSKLHYCHHCSRNLQSENALRMVSLNSSIHRSKNVACPFCKAAFTSASGLSHHLETGSCPRAKNINYRTIHQAISQRDPSSLLTKKLLTYPDSDKQNIATNATWNGSSYECYICHRKHDTVQALNQHLSSLVHSEKLYHCPNRSCNGQFVSLAGLFNHLESESCKFVRFENIQKHVHNFITGQQKLLSFA